VFSREVQEIFMDGVKGFAAIFEHLLYELLGLLVPGAATVRLVASVWSSTSWDQALAFADRAPWIAIGVAYLVGYVVQGISRPVTSLVELLLRGPVIVGSALLGWVAPRLRKRLRGWRDRASGFLTRKHRHAYGPAPEGQPVDLRAVARDEWTRRLRLPDGKLLSDSQVRDLSFSALLGNLGRLDRFRSSTSLARGTATAAAVTLVILCAQLLAGLRPATSGSFGALAALLLSFFALLSRADFYDWLWNEVLLPQFLAHVSSGKDRDEGQAEERD
jgi:hypothetical protein